MKLIRRSDWARLTPTELVLGLWVCAMDSGGCSMSGCAGFQAVVRGKQTRRGGWRGWWLKALLWNDREAAEVSRREMEGRGRCGG